MQSTSGRLFSPRNLLALGRGRIPGQVVVQVTDSCNAHCPQCEMRVGNKYRRSDLQKESIEKILDSAADQGAAAVSFTGGEPFLQFATLIEGINRAGELGIPLVRTGTNGYFLRHHRRSDFKKQVEKFAVPLASSPLRNLWFSLDSAVPEVHDRMRGLPGLFEGIAKSIPIFHEHGIWPTANLGVNRSLGGKKLRLAKNAGREEIEAFYSECLEAFSSFYQKVIDVGFTIVNFCYPMSIESQPESGLNSVYRASSADDLVSFSHEEKVLLFQAMSESVTRFRDRIRIFTPRSMLYSLVQQYKTHEAHGYPCQGGRDFFFVSAVDGNAYPCGFRASENLGKYWSLESTSEAKGAECTQCDWECLRDPSNTLGPIQEYVHSPIQLLNRLRSDQEWIRLWWQDLRYQRAADFFNGRIAPDYKRLTSFAY